MLSVKAPCLSHVSVLLFSVFQCQFSRRKLHPTATSRKTPEAQRPQPWSPYTGFHSKEKEEISFCGPEKVSSSPDLLLRKPCQDLGSYELLLIFCTGDDRLYKTTHRAWIGSLSLSLSKHLVSVCVLETASASFQSACCTKSTYSSSSQYSTVTLWDCNFKRYSHIVHTGNEMACCAKHFSYIIPHKNACLVPTKRLEI